MLVCLGGGMELRLLHNYLLGTLGQSPVFVISVRSALDWLLALLGCVL